MLYIFYHNKKRVCNQRSRPKLNRTWEGKEVVTFKAAQGDFFFFFFLLNMYSKILGASPSSTTF